MNHVALSSRDINDDFVLWLEHQIELIRERQFARVDIDNLVDELEFIVSSRQKALRTRLSILTTHLLKCEYQPDHKSNSWLSTIGTQRNAIDRLIEQSPSLGPQVLPSAAHEYTRALRLAAQETTVPKSAFPSELPYTEQQLLDFDFIP